ncbi:NGFI-A-binding protein 1-like isoform X2 [Physella acuta]|uniref:NGFI-A-binding protein 1-like isoform X2 n=1 Tax=Physella acuta TaxID=109671 RepID=UPI0027DD1A64|nr:NGFI-A-binding protein 1-like isoform X2 [Physella acuta]
MASVQPSNNSELQLYRVLQRANLLQYFETFITQGGDDVQQLCEAGEDEFLEIMALVGMASKPLHVRRLQKALQEWVANPAAFEVIKKYPTHVMSMAGSSQALSPSHSIERSNNIQDFKVTPPQSSAISTSTPWACQSGVRGVSPSEGSNLEHPSPSDSPQADFKDIMKDVLYNPDDQSYAGMMGLSQPTLLEHQITAIATAAAMLAQTLPPFEPKSMPKKQISKEISCVMMMPLDDPNRMDALRKYAAIYGRFDSKRKNDRPMSLHEISVNEAAAQLCSHFPALLTRREELFPLARQVVRDSGYQYSKGHSRAAEVLVQPKLEQGEAIPSTSTLLSSSTILTITNEESFNELQAELTQITLDLTELSKEQDRIRSALRVLLEANDHDQMKTLTSEMDDLNDRQSALTKKRQRIINTIAKYRKGSSKYSVPSVSLARDAKLSPTHGNLNPKIKGSYIFTDDSSVPNPLNTLYMAAIHNHKDSLFEEGLRIATQYGMSDFAQELIGMKTKDKDDEHSDSSINMSSDSSATSAFAAFTTLSALPSSMPSPAVTPGTPPLHPTGARRGRPPSSHSAHRIKAATPNSFTKTTVEKKSFTNGSFPNSPAMKSPNIHEKNNNSSSETSSIGAESPSAQGSLTTTTTITKNGQVIEVETRRSSRRKNCDPDYYLINGGEKRFRTSSNRRSSSTSSERVRRLSSSSSASSANPGTPTSSSPCKPNPDHPTNDDIIRMGVNELRRRDGREIQKVMLDFNPGNTEDAADHVEEAEISDLDKRSIKKTNRLNAFPGHRLVGSEYTT